MSQMNLQNRNKCINRCIKQIKVVTLKFPEAYFRENEVAGWNHVELRGLSTDTYMDGIS